MIDHKAQNEHKKSVFRGAATALITPFDPDGEVDYPSLGGIIENQIENGVSALVVCGTTGEAAALSEEEHARITEFSVAAAKGRVPVIAGAGSNCTKKAAALCRAVTKAGADAVLSVTPYYNKGNADGIYRHFAAIAAETDKPVIVYNVPSRTGVNLSLPLYERLAEIENVAAVKEASYDMAAAVRLFAALGDRLDIYCGNDDITLPFLSLGASGVISVVSNVAPDAVSKACRAYFDGDDGRARALFAALLPLCGALFCDVNPVPVKTAMAALGFCDPDFRLPLAPPDETVKKRVTDALAKGGYKRV